MSTSERVFWNWFEQNETRLLTFETDRETILDEISEKLSAYREGIVFEISTEADGKREFIVSADGLEELFPAVETLVASAPKLERWSIIAFRPRMDNYARFRLDYEGMTIDPSQLWIQYGVDEGKFDLVIFHPQCNEDNRTFLINGTYILLDAALGEYHVVKGIRYIDHEQLPSSPEEEGLRPFSELRTIFDKYKRPGH